MGPGPNGTRAQTGPGPKWAGPGPKGKAKNLQVWPKVDRVFTLQVMDGYKIDTAI